MEKLILSYYFIICVWFFCSFISWFMLCGIENNKFKKNPEMFLHDPINKSSIFLCFGGWATLTALLVCKKYRYWALFPMTSKQKNLYYTFYKLKEIKD